jgi:hypothetical protein
MPRQHIIGHAIMSLASALPAQAVFIDKPLFLLPRGLLRPALGSSCSPSRRYTHLKRCCDSKGRNQRGFALELAIYAKAAGD